MLAPPVEKHLIIDHTAAGVPKLSLPHCRLINSLYMSALAINLYLAYGSQRVAVPQNKYMKKQQDE